MAQLKDTVIEGVLKIQGKDSEGKALILPEESEIYIGNEPFKGGVSSEEIQQMGFVTNNELDKKDFVTNNELNQKGYVTATKVGGNELGLVKNGGNVTINPDGTMRAPTSSGGKEYGVGGDELGLVKNGGNVTINPDGTMRAPSYESEGENSFATNETSIGLCDYSFASGINTISGGKGFKVLSRNGIVDEMDGTGSYTLDSIVGLKIEDTYSIRLQNNYDYRGIIDSIQTETNTIVVTNYIDEKVNSDREVILWIPEKPTIGTTKLGQGSHTEGYQTRALCYGSHAEGCNTEAGGRYSHAEGNSTKAGYAAHAEGVDTKALGVYSHAEGIETTASGHSAHAEGTGTTASGYTSHAEGIGTTASGHNSHAEGTGTTASANQSHAEGLNSSAKGDQSHAEGRETWAEGKASHAEGSKTWAKGNNSHAEGHGTYTEGDTSHAEGYKTSAFAYCSHAEGCETTANAEYSHAEGYKTTASGEQSHAEGSETTASGKKSHAEGSETWAFGYNSHTEGYKTIANGEQSHAEGNGTTAEGNNSHAEGAGTLAFADQSHAEGLKTIANGDQSHAEGLRCTAEGSATHAEGADTLAYAPRSHAEGVGTKALGYASHVQGKYNVVNNDAIDFPYSNRHYAHIVGNGTSDTNRSNAHTVSWEGQGYFAQGTTMTGADYAEFFEWQDGNPDNEDRVGLLVALDGEKIRLANSGDEVLGIISGTAAVLGDNYECEWNGKYLTDDFGRIIYDLVEEFIDEEHIEFKEVEKEIIDEETNETKTVTELEEVITTEKKSIGFWKHPRLNPDYNPEQAYINRSDRPEWDAVGMLGKLYVRDNGTCIPNFYATVGENGIATSSLEKTNMRVLSRVNDNVVRVLLK